MVEDQGEPKEYLEEPQPTPSEEYKEDELKAEDSVEPL